MSAYTRTELEKQTIPQLKLIADSLDVEYVHRIHKADLVNAILEYQPIFHDVKNDEPVRGEFPVSSATNHVRSERRVKRQPKPERGRVNGQPMPLHYMGRATGAKHLRLLDAIANGVHDTGERKRFTPATFMPSSERVQNYARQNSLNGTLVDKPKLTHRQMRHVRKNLNRHDESFVYVTPKGAQVGYKPRGYSLLARTPDGRGIYHQFAMADG
jgi:hypothetical protein